MNDSSTPNLGFYIRNGKKCYLENIATHEETQERMAVYYQFAGDGDLWVTPISKWQDKEVTEKDNNICFAVFMSNYIAEYNSRQTNSLNKITRATIIELARLPSNGYKLLSGERRINKRDYVVRIGIAADMSIGDIQYCMKLCDFNPLSSNYTRDSYILKIISSKAVYTPTDKINEIQAIMEKYNLDSFCLE